MGAKKDLTSAEKYSPATKKWALLPNHMKVTPFSLQTYTIINILEIYVIKIQKCPMKKILYCGNWKRGHLKCTRITQP